MILKKKYLEKEKIQKVWYESSMIVYSEMKEDEYENKGDLTVVFKNGSAYVYKDVKLEDYILFIGGGTDASQGKTLNKIIKGKYEYYRTDDRDLNKLNEELAEKDNNDIWNTYFISGHRNLTETEFEYYYIPAIINVLDNNPEAKFVVGDSVGCDVLSQNYLIDVLGVDPDRITVYCVDEHPENAHPKITNIENRFGNHDVKDEEMTKKSIADIAFVRTWKEISGTAQNILRRNSFN